MKGYKGFDKDLQCRGKQYEVGKTFKEQTAKLCKSGMHFCENPLEVFYYYGPSNGRFCEIEADGVTKESDNDTKRACTELTVKAEIGIPGIIKAGVEYIKSKVDWDNAKESNTGCSSAATNTGNSSAATNTGERSLATNTGCSSAATNTGCSSAATNTGNSSVATNTGYSSVATNTGYSSAATNTGERSVATNTGERSLATNTGYRSVATNTGERSVATNTGERSASTVEGAESVAIALGIEGKAKGAKGCWIVLAEWTKYGNIWHRKIVKSYKVDGKRIKANTFYKLQDGKAVETE